MLLSLICGCLVTATQAPAVIPTEIHAAKIFGSHMVLQHGRPICIWGEGPPGESVTVVLGADTRETRADNAGRWAVLFPAHSPSSQPIILQVQATVFDDVLIGDVWLCSGQSNMAFELKRTPAGNSDLKTTANPLVRVAHHTALRLTASEGYSPEELARCNVRDFFACQWLTGSDPLMGEASAVAWYFGQQVQSGSDTPVGLVVVAVGGSALNNWIPATELRRFPETKSLFTKDWLSHPDVKPRHRTRAREAFQHVLEPSQPFLAGQMPYRWLCEPAFLFEAGIEPLRGLELRGVVWYQGESDAGDARAVMLATELLPMLIRSWRANFRAPDLPWLMVQLPSHDVPYWPAFRELQQQVIERSGHAALAVTIDLGERKNVHPVDKKPVGERLARLALRQVYDRNDVVPFPAVEKIEQLTGRVRLKLANCPGGLQPATKPIAGFELADENGVFHPTPAKMAGPDTLELESGAKPAKQVRYLWAGFPEPRPQLYNHESLPLGPFVEPVPPVAAAR